MLHSPIMSGMRVLTDSRALACLDIYPNIERIGKVQCPVWVIHGKLDEAVSLILGPVAAFTALSSESHSLLEPTCRAGLFAGGLFPWAQHVRGGARCLQNRAVVGAQ